jgi:hypothetical protein
VPVNHYVEVDFRGFQGLVDTLGGVPIYFDQPARDRNTGFSIDAPGCYKLGGEQALAFARSRHLEVLDGTRWVEDPTADLGRITRQQLFLRKALDRAKGLGLTDVLKINRLLDVATDNVTLDGGLSLSRVAGVARRFASVGQEAVVTFSLPTEPVTTSGGAAVLRLRQDAAQPALDVFRGVIPLAPATEPSTTTTALAPPAVTVDVLNGTGITGQAGLAADRLRAFGFVVGQVGDAGTKAQARTQLRYARDHRQAAELVATAVRGKPELVEDGAAATSVVLVTGADFAGVDLAPAGGSTSTSAATTVPGVTTTTHIGFAPEAPPPGVTCG